MARNTLYIDGMSNCDFTSERVRWDIIKDIAEKCSEKRPIERLDLSNAIHLRPYVVALCVGACKLLGNDKLSVEWPDYDEAANHLARLNLPKILKTGGPRANKRLTNIPLSVLKQRQSEKFAWDVVELLEQEFDGFRPGDKRELSDAIDEMTLNALTHSESPIGAVVTAQAFPRTNRVEAVVLDFGVTIKGHLSKRYTELADDAEAILKATEDGVTGTEGLNKFGEPNSGAGLHVVRTYLQENRGELAILSGGSVVTFSDDVRTHHLYGTPFGGTLVSLCFDTT